VKERKLNIQTVRLTYLYIRCNGKTAIHKRPAGGIWQGLWEPFLTTDSPLLTRATLLCKDVKHILTHRILLADFYFLEVQEPPTLPDDYIWVEEADLDRYAFPRLIELLLERVSH